jgi:hypothetical protein
MNFIQNQIDRGYTRIIITFRGKKEFINGVPKITAMFTTSSYSGIDTVEKYNNLMKMVSDFPNGVSVGFAKP